MRQERVTDFIFALQVHLLNKFYKFAHNSDTSILLIINQKNIKKEYLKKYIKKRTINYKTKHKIP